MTYDSVLHFVPTSKLAFAFNPMHGGQWGIDRISAKLVRSIKLADGPYDFCHHIFSDESDQHHARIAWLARFGWQDPISIDVGCPSLGVHGLCLQDGYHRLCAAIISKRTKILVEAGGEIDQMPELFFGCKEIKNAVA